MTFVEFTDYCVYNYFTPALIWGLVILAIIAACVIVKGIIQDFLEK